MPFPNRRPAHAWLGLSAAAILLPSLSARAWDTVWKAEAEGRPYASIAGIAARPGGDFLFGGALEQGASVGGFPLSPPAGSFGGVFIGRLDAAGQRKGAESIGPGILRGGAFAVDLHGHAHVGVDLYCGSRRWQVGPDTLDATDCGNTAYVAKLDPAGKVLWARDWPRNRPAGSEESRSERADALTVDDSGHVYLSGVQALMGGDPAFDTASMEFFLAKLGPDGRRIWRRTFRTRGKPDNYPETRPGFKSLVAGPDGGLTAAGFFRGALRYRVSAGAEDSLVSAGADDICLLTFAPDGFVTKALRPGSAEGPYGSAVIGRAAGMARARPERVRQVVSPGRR